MRKNRWNLNKSQRMQVKALACALGLALLVVLLLIRLLFLWLSRGEEPKIHIPVIRQLENVWIMEVREDGLQLFVDGKVEICPFGMAPDPGLGTEAADGGTRGEGGELPYPVPREYREQVADVTLTDDRVTQVTVKTQKVNGRLLSASADGIELEGLGRFPISDSAKGYRLYGTLAMCSARDLMIGYDFTDFVVENGEVCAFLMAKEDAMESIRVLLKSADYGGSLHESVTFTCDSDFTINYGDYANPSQELHRAGEICTVEPDSAYFGGGRVSVEPSVLTGRITISSAHRSQGEPSYRGRMEFLNTPEGIAVINEVLLEEYLYSVVPSEMPASYPSEALKAQAVCARTYAYDHMLKAGYPQYGAHVDDSTSYQVYNNILEQEATTTAVKDTYGQLLYTGPEGELAGAYYYSTSCGYGSDAGVWKPGTGGELPYLKARALNRPAMDQILAARGEQEQEASGQASAAVSDMELAGRAMSDEETFAAFIRGKNADDFEVTEGWYRWTYTVKDINTEHMLEAIQKRYEANKQHVLTLNKNGEFESAPVEELDKVTGLEIVKRGSGGIAEELLITTGKHTYKVITEHNIRYVLNDGETRILRQDGSEIASQYLLPSGFFIIDTGKEKENVVGYTLTGGGFGHGVGMSQNGARSMAKAGYTAEDILKFFYDGCVLKSIYDRE